MIDINNKIYNIDAVLGMSEIPDCAIDMVFTDPPYKLSPASSTSKLLNVKNTVHPFSMSKESFNVPTPEFSYWIPSTYRVLKEGGYFFCMINDRNMRKLWDTAESCGFKFCQLLVMKKRNVVAGTFFYKNCEFILLFRKGNYAKFKKYGFPAVTEVTMPIGKNKIHPTQKPVEILYPAIESCSSKNELILDPFMGSGSTAIACINKERRYIGFEMDTQYYELSLKRIADGNK